MNAKYLIKTFGHCGSMYVHHWLANNQNCRLLEADREDFDITHYDVNSNLSIHTHCYWLPEKPSQWRFVHVCRKNKFDQAISFIISLYTNQRVKYDNKRFLPITVPYSDLMREIGVINYWDKIFDLQSSLEWDFVYKLYFEDFINDSDNLNIIRHSDQIRSFYKEPCISYKNPRKHCDIVKNYYELLETYNRNNIDLGLS